MKKIKGIAVKMNLRAHNKKGGISLSAILMKIKFVPQSAVVRTAKSKCLDFKGLFSLGHF